MPRSEYATVPRPDVRRDLRAAVVFLGMLIAGLAINVLVT